jgi:hypothetical protein
MYKVGVRFAGHLDGDARQPHYFFFTFLLFFYFASFLCSLKPYIFSLFFKILLLFYSLNSQSLDLQTYNSSSQQHHPLMMVAANLTSSKPPCKQAAILRLICISHLTRSQLSPSSPLHPLSVSLLYTVANKEVEPQFLDPGMTL